MRRFFWLTICLSGACTFSLSGVDLGGVDLGGSDGSTVDLAGEDLAGFDLVAPPGEGGDPCASCPGRCGGSPQRCLNLMPSGVVTRGDTSNPTLAAVTLTGDTNFNTDDGSITGGLVRAAGPGVVGGISFRDAAQPGPAPHVGVFGFASLNIMPGVTVTFLGKNAVAFATAGDATVAGTINLTGTCIGGAAGPGGFKGAPGDGMGPGKGGKGAGAGDPASGGGGGGYGDTGGRGGNGSNSTQGGTAGVAYGDLSVDPLVLQGGSGGGGGGGGAMGGVGGSGGGALQISANGIVAVSGIINAGGCGGAAGGGGGGGGGGGAGGAIVLEGAEVHLEQSAILAANGGGGGGADAGQGGTAGPASGQAGGSGGTGANNGTRGGAGGVTGASSGRQGIDVTDGEKNGGGGGGGLGRIGLRTRTGTIANAGAVLSPQASDQAAGKSLLTTTVANFQ